MQALPAAALSIYDIIKGSYSVKSSGNLGPLVMYSAWKENLPEMQKYKHTASPLEANALPERSGTCKEHD